ncbi:MAG: carbamoyltransferase HypF [Endomicrobiia bacterium]
MKAKKIEVYGKVQSVGFRPFIYNLAKRFDLKGYIRNKTSSVEILVEGKEQSLNEFLKKIRTNPPKSVLIQKILVNDDAVKNFVSFDILESEPTAASFVYIPAEIKICDECIKELLNPHDRRYLYPFINCTQCGPRFTIIERLPYDRKNTTMKVFKMCEECLNEYEDPSNRRFHAQPNCCHRCGPGLIVKDKNLDLVFKISRSAEDVKKILDFIVEKILDGKIFAIKSYGGYHLVCDATNDEVVLRLRKNKYREFKPFAMMASSIEAIERYCVIDNSQKELLKSSQAPIVLLVKKTLEDSQISKYVADGSKYYGFMLPYTPLHFLIFEWLKRYKKDIPLIMTSANISEEPQVYKESEAFHKLRNLTDYFVFYNRKINIRCDDSVCKTVDNNIYFIRRSRGWAPEPIFVKYKFAKNILSFGADLKNTFSLAKDNHVVVSHHIGDLYNLEAINSYMQSIDHYLKTFGFSPDVIVCDLHPEYISSKIARKFAKERSLTCLEIQHHYAHMLSCMLENDLFEKCIGVVFDGTGYGLDGTIWGSEFLVGDIYGFFRKAHFENITLIGADKGIKEPYRSALAFLYEEYKNEKILENFWSTLQQNLTGSEILSFSFKDMLNAVRFLLDKKINLTETSGMGRFFDIVCVFCGFGAFNYYEGYLPQLLEFNAGFRFEEIKNKDRFYEYEVIKQENKYVVKTKLLLKKIFEDVFFKKEEVKTVAAKFHYTILKITEDVLLKIRNDLNINKVILSGGVFQNEILVSYLYESLKKLNFEVFIHRKIPCNDAGISFGQSLATESVESLK